MDNTSDLETSAVAPQPQSTTTPPATVGIPWPAVLFLVLVVGVLGWLVGRQAPLPTEPAALIAAATPVVTNIPAAALDTAAPTTNTNAISNGTVTNRPTPVVLTPETITALGDPNAPVTIVEFSDYQCPFCLRHFQQTMPAIKRDYIDTGRVYYVFKDFPIPSLHPVAARVHEAALCAGELGGQAAYWQSHDTLFTAQAQWADQPQPALDNILVTLLQSEAVSEGNLRDCLDSGHNARLVQADMAEGRAAGINGTPSFFINGYPLSGAQAYDVFQQVITMAEEGRLADAFSRPTGPNDGKAQATAAAQAAQPVNIVLGDAPMKGDVNAPITIVEYSDYQCPFCLRHFQQTMPLLQEYIDNGQVRYLFKDFPIHSIHPQAQKAHESARCARAGGGTDAYWAMHDALFTSQQEWGSTNDHVAVFKRLASELDLEEAAFATCLDSGTYAAAVSQDLFEGQDLGIRGTPAFFINGQNVSGAQPFAVFQQLIDSLLVSNE